VDFHENIIRFCGITIGIININILNNYFNKMKISKIKKIFFSFKENQSDDHKKYLLVMEYADSGTLRNYFKESFENLTWNDKLNMALQLTHAVLCLHDEEIVHRDLVSYYILLKL